MTIEQFERFKKKVIDRATPEGSNTWVVGGACRDYMDGAKFIKDIDVVTDRKDEMVANLRQITQELGTDIEVSSMKRATVVVMNYPWPWLQVFRIEISDYQPDEEFTGGDRDFLCNAIHWKCGPNTTPDFNPTKAEISRMLLPQPLMNSNHLWAEHILEPVHRTSFTSNPVRIYRAADLISRSNSWTPSPECITWARDAVQHTTPDSGIRFACMDILNQIFKEMAMGVRKWPDVLRTLGYLAQTHALVFIHPELQKQVGFPHRSKWHTDTIWHHTLEVMDGIMKILETDYRFSVTQRVALYWAGLLHDIGKVESSTEDNEGFVHYHGHQKIGARITEELMAGAPMAPETKRMIIKMVRHHMDLKLMGDGPLKTKELYKLRQFLYDMGSKDMTQLFMILDTADSWASTREYRTYPSCPELVAQIMQILVDPSEPDWFNYKEPVTGAEIKEELNCENVLIGDYLKQIRRMAMVNPTKMETKEQALQYIHTLKGEWKKARLKEHKSSK